MIDVSPPKAVLVRRDGLWYDGWLEAWQQDDDGAWLGSVRYHDRGGMQCLDWVPTDRLLAI